MKKARKKPRKLGSIELGDRGRVQLFDGPVPSLELESPRDRVRIEHCTWKTSPTAPPPRHVFGLARRGPSGRFLPRGEAAELLVCAGCQCTAAAACRAFGEPNCAWFFLAPGFSWCTSCEAKKRAVDHVEVFNEAQLRTGGVPFVRPTAPEELEHLAQLEHAQNHERRAQLLELAGVGLRLLSQLLASNVHVVDFVQAPTWETWNKLAAARGRP